ncbi:MAG: hypothetical protein KatS3mg126_1569 [Lysobacteraceae bacterium]|nr:MAG: hypothetical protein KatS3mg126_1569 [Xanthomonadaceae bacterium]
MSTIAEGFSVEPADPRQERAILVALRSEALQDATADWDADDAAALHVLARDDRGRPAGTARLHADGRIDRIAVLPDWRDRGVAEALVVRLLDLARQRRLERVWAEAGGTSEAALRAAGLEPQPGTAILARTLDDLPALARSQPSGRVAPDEVEFEDVAGCRNALRTLLADTRRQLCICTRAMDPELFHGEEVLAELRRIATAGRGAELRILVQDPETALREGAPLLALAQRLPTAMPVRQTAEDEESAALAAAWLLNDRAGLLLRPLASRMEGSFWRHAPGLHREWSELFRRCWERAQPAAILRAQSL